MATIKLKIRNDLVKKNGNQSETTIYCQYCFEEKVKLFNTGVKVLPDHWDELACQVRKSPNYTTKNAAITKVKALLERIVQHAEFNNILPTLAYVEKEYKISMAPVQEPQEYVKSLTFLEYFELFIQSRIQSNAFAKSTISHYKVSKRHIENFIKTTRFDLTFDTADLKFYERYTTFLRNGDMRENTIGNEIKYLKTFLAWAVNEGYHTNMAFMRFKKPSEEVRVVSITEQELQRMIDLDLADNPRLDRVRDVFLFQCFTGLRYSDVVKVTTSDFKDDFLQVRTKKTGSELNIPILPEILPVLHKYNYDLPVITEQRQNEYLKELAVLAQITDTVNRVTVEKGKRKVEKVSKASLISTHVARRYFVTTAIKRGIPAALIMMVTGHKDGRTLQKYIKLVSADVKEAFAKGFQ